MGRRRRIVIAVLLLAGGTFAWIASDSWPWRGPLRAPPIRVTESYQMLTDTLGRRETLSNVLTRVGVTGSSYAAFVSTAAKLDVRRLRAGLVFHVRRPLTDSVADRLMVRLGPERRLWYARSGRAWTEREERIPWREERFRVRGTITTSLYESLDTAVPDTILPPGERMALAWAIADVYDWEVDFTRDVRTGDGFEVLFERLVSTEGERRFGRVVAARVNVGHIPSYAFYFETDTVAARGGFYDNRGRSLKRAFLRAPLQFRRISSRFGGRMHPVLHTYRRHQGVDYAATHGTPVRATADGSVARVGRDGGYGSLVELRHANGIRTRYGHLSGYARGLRVGQRVTQGETIGFVGSTGLSTGPHLHYEFLVNGRPTNPQRTNAGSGAPVPRELQQAFDAARARLALELEPPRAAAGVINID